MKVLGLNCLLTIAVLTVSAESSVDANYSYEILSLEFGTVINSTLTDQTDGISAESTQDVSKELQSQLTSDASTLEEIKFTKRDTDTRGTRDVLRLDPSGFLEGGHNVIPEEVQCSLNTRYRFAPCPKLEITLGSHEAQLEDTFRNNRKYYYCSVNKRLKIRKEAFRRTEFVIRLTCSYGREQETLILRILPRAPVPCNTTKQCRSEYSIYSECIREQFQKTCKCIKGYRYDGTTCIEYRNPSTSAAYRATLVAVGCFSVVVIALFILFICNRAFFRRNRREEGFYDDENCEGTDVYAVSDRLARLRLVDKPPTYADVLTADRLHRGVPPPAYQSSQDDAVQPGSSGLSRPLPDSPTEEVRNEDHARITRLATRLNQLRETNGEQNHVPELRTGPQDNLGYDSET